MIKILIDNREVELESVDERWITQQINRRIDDGLSPCVQVKIRLTGIDMILSSPTCPSAGRPRKATAQEIRILNIWEKCKMNTNEFTGGNLVAFLKQIR